MLHSSREAEPIDRHLGVDGRRSGAIWEHFVLQMGRFGCVLGRGNHAKTIAGEGHGNMRLVLKMTAVASTPIK